MRMSDATERERAFFEGVQCIDPGSTTPVAGPPLSERRIAIVTTAGLMQRGDRPFSYGSVDYRILPTDADGELVMTHVSANFDRTGFQQDVNVVFPLDRLREMAADGAIGSVAKYHYAFMGASDPVAMEPAAREVADALAADRVDGIVLVPV